MEVSLARCCPLAVPCALLASVPCQGPGSPAGLWCALAVGAVCAHAVCAAGHCSAAPAGDLGVSFPAVTLGDIGAVGSPGDCPGLVLD